jgi:hypothetical protein
MSANQHHGRLTLLVEHHVLQCQELAVDRDHRQKFQEVLVFQYSGFLNFFRTS